MASAEDELTDIPDVLRGGFHDPWGMEESIRSRKKFLIVGPKGSGKSALSARFLLDAETKEDTSVRIVRLSDFNFQTFSGLLPGNEAPEIKFPHIWEYLLLIAMSQQLLDDLSLDASGAKATGEEIRTVLTDAEFMPCRTLGEMVKKAATKKGRINVKVADGEQVGEYEQRTISPRGLYQNLRDFVMNSSTTTEHYLFIDDLDRALTKRTQQYEALSALVVAANDLNHQLKQSSIHASISVLCRSDLLSKLGGPNLNKIRQGRALQIDWHHDISDAHESELVKLVNLRAGLARGAPADLFAEFFPSEVYSGDRIEKTLIGYTRHRPRDFVMLLNMIQQCTSTAKPLGTSIKNGIRKYCKEYFIHEIRDELDGFVPAEAKELLLQAISSVKKSKFQLSDLQYVLETDARFSDLHMSALDICQALYESSAIGNSFRPDPSKPMRYLAFKHYNPDVQFNPNEDVVVHPALLKPLNVARTY